MASTTTSESELRTPSSTRWDSSNRTCLSRQPLSASSSFHGNIPSSAHHHQHQQQQHQHQHQQQQQQLGTTSCTPINKSSGTSAQDSNSESSSSVKKRRRTTPEELKILEDAYLVNSLPSSEERGALAERTGMGVRGVQIWFQNKRQTEKRKMLQVNHYPNVMIIPLPHPGHPAANLHPSDPRFVAAAQAGYAAYVPSVLQPQPQPPPSHLFANAAVAVGGGGGGGRERLALSPVDPNTRSTSSDQQGRIGKHEFGYSSTNTMTTTTPTPTTTYPFPPPRFAYSNPHGGYHQQGQYPISPMYAQSLPGMGHVYAAQVSYQEKMTKNGIVYASSSERTRRQVEERGGGSSPREEGYSSDTGAVDASSPIKKESGGGGVGGGGGRRHNILEFTDRRASEGLYRARNSIDGQLRATRADSTTSLPTPLPSVRALSELKTSRPILSRTRSATMTIRELAGLPSRPRSSLGFVNTPNVGVSRGILDEMCTRRELPFPHPPSSPIGERDEMMITPARGGGGGGGGGFTTRSRVSDPPSMTRSADIADDSSSIMVTDESDVEDNNANSQGPNVRGGGGGRLNSFSGRSNVTDDDEDRPTLRRLASLDYYAGTPARRSVGVGLGAVRMGAKSRATFGKTTQGKRGASEVDEDDEEDEQIVVLGPLRDIKRPRRDDAINSITPPGKIDEKIVPAARDEEAARLLLGLAVFSSV